MSLVGRTQCSLKTGPGQAKTPQLVEEAYHGLSKYEERLRAPVSSLPLWTVGNGEPALAFCSGAACAVLKPGGRLGKSRPFFCRLEDGASRMDMNFTTMARYIRLFGMPLLMIALGILLPLFLPDPGSLKETYLAGLHPLILGVHWLFLGVLAAGLTWFAWAGWQLHRWESGAMVGDCLSCGGSMSQLDGRYGPYRKCRYCGTKREGWK